MRRGLIPAMLLVVLAYGFASELALSLTLTENHCSCPIKSRCCRQSVCPMERAREASGQCSLRSCDHGEAAAATLRPHATFFASGASTIIEPPRLHAFIETFAMTLRGVTRVPDLPPRA